MSGSHSEPPHASSGARLRRLFPEPAEFGAEEIYADLRFPDPPQDRPYTAVNMVSTTDGRVTIRGRAGGIGGEVDRLAMRLLRSKVDAIMVGAGTVRSEKINLGLPADLRGLVNTPDPLGVVVSASGDVPPGNLVENRDERLLFLVSHDAPEEAVRKLSTRGEVRRLKELGKPFPDTARVDGAEWSYGAALSLLRREYGVRRLLVEGGPGVNHALVGAGLADELFLTFAPKLAGGAAQVAEPGAEPSGILSGAPFEEPVGLRLVSVYESGGELYLRYSTRRVAEVEEVGERVDQRREEV